MPEGYYRDLYFDWLFKQVCEDGDPYRKLLLYLFDREFTYILPMDAHRASDGEYLRYTFATETGLQCYISGPCSVLEMIIALSKRCEQDIMDDPIRGNRTKQWFWEMIINLGLNRMTDQRFDEHYVKTRIDILLNRNYKPNGEGGLFFIPESKRDLRTVEIWYQLLWYLDSIF